ncbi:hypothetical protein EX895_001604 [Sporisorium graminicola]|uniref:SET domain-containing protein n=1 Tax=Sporisorium graminicola TaxID=280036 RepID=A0A4U7KWQ5_9BASI|nr:hypothetical protein EX895_001604 [Sporisorium graminicola]TKY89073.1 hypothetical protein EX895_001604 [Sporisorium graminicola]
MPKEAVVAPLEGSRGVNALAQQGPSPNHSPTPCQHSALNTRAREWWARHQASHGRKAADDGGLQVPSSWPKHVVFITQSLVAPSVPDSVARRYVLSPSATAVLPQSDDTMAGPSKHNDLPRATHNDGRPETLYTTSVQHQVPVVIHPIDKGTPWCPESFHSTSRNLSCHPAAGSFGLFAAEDIAPNTFIRPYLGVLHTKADADFYSTYDLSLCHDSRLCSTANPSQSDTSDSLANQIETLSLDHDGDPAEQDLTALYLDSRYWGNESRFVNDYRGIAAKPNVEFRSFLQHCQEDGEPRFQMGLFATGPIRKGQELLINYGKSFWVHYEQLHELKSMSDVKSAPSAKREQSTAGKPEVKLDPIQAMLQRSRLRVAKAAISRPPHQPHSRS